MRQHIFFFHLKRIQMGWNPGCFFLPPSLYFFYLSFSLSTEWLWGSYVLLQRNPGCLGLPSFFQGGTACFFTLCQSREEEFVAE